MSQLVQDWDEIKIGSKGRAPKVAKTSADINASFHYYFTAARRAGAVVATDKKISAGGNKAHAGRFTPTNGTDHQRIAKLDRENEVAPPPKVSASVGKAIQQGRMDKGFTQKEVAQKVNEKPSVIQDYESGKAIPNPQILGKLERCLGVKLRGNDIGKKLEAPKKS
ncbi:hypothetical protein Clacol_006746 [Clathrus columnatus]|uniref:HTH cro/C1-type domain-containing protein n=1 Tax=Clathrus columnatus TaxID=1419009 RepID=A0AAV5AH95_9AGAM|nr:hypothetical protein Clacol_006746 [Clathrus columnatus]